MDLRSPADLTMAYASASSIQPRMPAHHSQQNLVERMSLPVSRGIVTKEQWNAVKPVILKLYIIERKPFKQVVEILRKEYDFYPTENQFKKKINQWEFKKNFKEHELLAAIESISGQGNGQLDVKVGGFQVPDRRIKRVQQKAKLRAASQHLLSRGIYLKSILFGSGKISTRIPDYEEMDIDQADDKITDFSPTSVSVREIHDGQDLEISVPNQDPSVEMVDLIEMLSPLADEIDEIIDMATLCERLSSFGFNADPEILRNPTYVSVRIPKGEYLSKDDLEDISAPISTLSAGPQATDSSKSTELAVQSSGRKSPLTKPPDWQFIKVALGMGTINTLSPFPNPTPTSMNRSSSSGHRTTKWEQIGFEVAKHKANLCKLVDTFGPENPGALHAMAELAYWYHMRQDYKSAEYLCTKTAYAYEKAFGLADERTLWYYIGVVESLSLQRKYLDAENLHNAFHPIILSDFGCTSELGISSTRILAHILEGTNRESEAEELFRQNLQIQLNIYGPWHTQALDAMAFLSYYYGYSASSLECERLSYTILQIQNAALNFAEEERLRQLVNLADSQYRRGNFEKSISTFEKVAAQRKILLGVDNPNTLNIQRRICRCLRMLGRFVECEELLQDTLKKQLRIFGEEHSTVFYTFRELGYTFRYMGCHRKAIPCFQTTIDIGLRLFDHDNSDISGCIQDLGYCYKQEDRHEEAMELYYQHIERLHKVVSDVQQQVSELYGWVLGCINKLGERYEVSDNFQDALTLYYEHLERLLPNTGNNHEVVTTLSDWIVWNIRKLGEHYEHETCYRDALVLYYQHLEKLTSMIGKDHKEVELLCDWIVWNVGNLRQSYEDDGHHEEALELYQHHLDQLVPTLGMDHELIAKLRDWIQNLEGESTQSPTSDCVMEDVL